MRKQKEGIVSVMNTAEDTQLFKLVCTFDDVCHGKNSGQAARYELLKRLVTMFSSKSAAQSKRARTQVIETLQKESALSKIRKSFPNFLNTPQIIELIHSSFPMLQGLFISVLYLSDMQKDEDLFNDILELADNMDRTKRLGRMQQCLKQMIQGIVVIPAHFSEFQSLRTIANVYSIAGTMKELPEVTIDLDQKSKKYNEIEEAIKRFPVAEELVSVQGECRARIPEILNDIVDIFDDYTQGETRKKALKLFPELCQDYVTTKD